MFSNNMNTPSLSDIAAVTGNRNSDGMWGGDGWWAIIIFAMIFGWGGFGNGFGGNGGGYAASTTAETGYIDAAIQRGFDTQAITNKLNGLENGICSLGYDQLGQMNNLNQNVSNTGYAIQNAVQQASTANMQNAFGIQQAISADTVANMQNTNALAAQLSNCCCENREAIANVRYDAATQTAALQNEMNTNTRDIIEAQNSGTRAILDYLCQDKISSLTAENQALKFAASQSNQNAYLAAMSDAQTAELIRRINPSPVPAFAVPAPYAYGNCCGTSCNG